MSDLIDVVVERINVPAMSTIGYGYGKRVDTGQKITFAEGHRYMRHLGEELMQSYRDTGEQPTVQIEQWMILED
jgi:hypothetical protein